MAVVKLYKPLNMFSPPSYDFRLSDQVVAGGYIADRWIMTNDLRMVVLYGGFSDTVVAYGVGTPEGTHLYVGYTSFQLTEDDKADFRDGEVYGLFPKTLGGDDEIEGSSAADVIRGYGGDDSLNGQSGADIIYGEDGADELFGNMGNDSLYGGAGEDTLIVGRGADLAVGNAGSDWVAVEGPSAVSIDLLRTGAQAIGPTATAKLSGIENIRGTSGSDRLFGNNGANAIDAGNGNDAINGRNGADVLTGGPGSDTLVGGTGADQFVFWTGSGRDYIRDFTNGVDKIVFNYGPAGFDELKIIDDGYYAVIAYGRDWIRLDKVDVQSLDASDFVFL